MILQCAQNHLDSLIDIYGDKICEYFNPCQGHVDLTIGKLYVPYAVEFTADFIFCYVADDSYSELCYPVSYPSLCFNVIDDFNPSCWKGEFVSKKDISCRFSKRRELVSFSEWNNSKSFYEKLVDGASLENLTFRRRKDEIDSNCQMNN